MRSPFWSNDRLPWRADAQAGNCAPIHPVVFIVVKGYSSTSLENVNSLFEYYSAFLKFVQYYLISTSIFIYLSCGAPKKRTSFLCGAASLRERDRNRYRISARPAREREKRIVPRPTILPGRHVGGAPGSCCAPCGRGDENPAILKAFRRCGNLRRASEIPAGSRVSFPTAAVGHNELRSARR